ncbi:hypothetical protein ACFE04_020263 [Oxalis oulophora]
MATSSGSNTLTTTTAATATISTLPPDIIETHILTRLDGPTLASAGCTSSQLHTLASQESLWSRLCHSTWPSTAVNHRVRHLISTHGPRWFFSSSFTNPEYCMASSNTLSLELIANHRIVDWLRHHLTHKSLKVRNPLEALSKKSRELISAVDIHYGDDLVLSKVVETETISDWFMCSPFRVDLLDTKEKIRTRLKHEEDDTCRNLIDNLTLSWIIIDPVETHTLAMNLSSNKPVSVQRHWLTREIHVRFASILMRGSSEMVLCEINLVICTRMHVREVSLRMEDMEGMHLNGRDSLVILVNGLECKRRVKWENKEVECVKRYEQFLEMKRLRKERKLRHEGTLDSLCVTFGALAFAFLFGFFLFG